MELIIEISYNLRLKSKLINLKCLTQSNNYGRCQRSTTALDYYHAIISDEYKTAQKSIFALIQACVWFFLGRAPL